MGVCNNCVYFTQVGTSTFDGFFDTFRDSNNQTGQCMLFVDNYGNYRKVRGQDSCNNFSAKPTASNSGYTKGSGCFLTSACVDYLGKADDCEELTILRKFRDEYMKPNEKYAPLVQEYYHVAPAIVEFINSSPDKDKYYQYIYSVVLKCIDLISN